MMGQFHVTDADGFRLVIFRPANLTEAKAGVPMGVIALQDGQESGKLADFLNAALLASHGDRVKFDEMMPPRRALHGGGK